MCISSHRRDLECVSGLRKALAQTAEAKRPWPLAVLIQFANTGSHPAGSNMAQAPGQSECLYRAAETLHPLIYGPCLPILGQNCKFFRGNLMNKQGGK